MAVSKFQELLSRVPHPNALNLDLVGILLLAPLDLLKQRIAFRGTATMLDTILICPGLCNQKDAPDLAKGEYPACAAMTSGYVFRVENEATVYQLQNLGKPGCLTTVKVSRSQESQEDTPDPAFLFGVSSIILSLAFWMLNESRKDWWGVICITMLVLANFINIFVIKRRSALGWKGAPEPGVQSDLLILLSQDRWIRMRGLTDDVKAVTSGQWLRESTPIEAFFTNFTTMLVYLDIVLLKNATLKSQIFVLLSIAASALLVGLSNAVTKKYRMYDRVIEMDGDPKKYARRLDLADKLVKETGRKDWAIRLGMIQAEQGENDNIEQGPKTM